MTPLHLTIDHLLGRPSEKVEWLERVAGYFERERANGFATGLAGPEGPEPVKPSPPSAASLSQENR